MKMINNDFDFSPFADEAADINSNCNRRRLWCERANLLLVRYLSWIIAQQLQLLCEKIVQCADIAWIELFRISFRQTFLLLSTRPSSFANVPSHASTLREISFPNARWYLQQSAKPDVGLGKQQIRSSFDTSLWRWNFKSDHFDHRTRFAKFEIGVVDRFW
jgi:hypothetical protein